MNIRMTVKELIKLSEPVAKAHRKARFCSRDGVWSGEARKAKGYNFYFVMYTFDYSGSSASQTWMFMTNGSDHAADSETEFDTCQIGFHRTGEMAAALRNARKVSGLQEMVETLADELT